MQTEVLLTDPRYTTQLQEECPDLDLEVRRPGESILDVLVKLIFILISQMY